MRPTDEELLAIAEKHGEVSCIINGKIEAVDFETSRLLAMLRAIYRMGQEEMQARAEGALDGEISTERDPLTTDDFRAAIRALELL